MEIRRILRLYQSGKSKRFIAEYLGISRNTVNKYLDLVVLSGQSLEVLLQKSDQELNRIFESRVINKPEKLFESVNLQSTKRQENRNRYI